jgi:membrane protein YdbS with pleckstrin-like domain
MSDGGDDRTESGRERGSAGVAVERERRRVDPSEYTTDRRSLSPRVQINWAVRTTVTAVVVGLIATFTLRAFDLDPRMGGVLTAVLVLLGFVWVVLHYRIWVYQIQDDAIYLERGVLTHVRTLVPYVRIQHVDTSRGPVERTLGLSTLVVYTAGSRGADISVPGLTPEEASDLQQRVKQLAIEAEGDDAL